MTELVLDSLSKVERARIAGELAAKSSAMTSATGIQKLSITREVLALIARLSGDTVKPFALDFSLNDKAASAASIAAYVNAGLPGLSDAVAACEEVTLDLLATQLGDNDLSRRVRNYSADRGVDHFHTNTTRLAVYEEFAGKGVTIDLDRDAIVAAHESAQEELKRGAHGSPEYVAAKQEYDAYFKDTQARLNAIRDQVAAIGNQESELADQLTEEFKRIRDVEYPQRMKELSEAANAAALSWQQSLKARNREGITAHGERVIAAVLEASPVSEQEAIAWAQKQTIDSDAKAKLKRIGYAPDQVIRDMAEFYRMTGGKASAVRLSTNRAKRAHAVGVTTAIGEKTIVMDGNFDKTTLFHELAHFLENDPVALAASNGFLLKRRESDRLYRLRDLSGHKGYRNDELAWKDQWLHPYIGKQYDGGVTECFSMAVQYLADPDAAVMFAAKDPEMFAYVTGYLSSPLTPGMRAKLSMHGTAIGELEERRATEEQLYEKAIKQLAATVTLNDDGWYEPGRNRSVDMNLKGISADGKAPEFIGSAGQFRVFAGVFKNIATGRRTKCHVVARLEDQFREQGWLSSSDWAPVVGGMEKVKAFIAICQQRYDQTGSAVRNTYYETFNEAKGYKSKKPLVIKAAGLAHEGVTA